MSFTGSVFLKNNVVVDGVLTFPDIEHYKAHEKLFDVTWDARTSGKVCQAFVNEFVTVATGPLFDDNEEFHLMATRNFIMPSTEHHEAHALACGYWERSAMLYGVPFKGDLTDEQVHLILGVFGKTRRVATTVVSIPASAHCPSVVLIGSGPATIPTAINSQGAYATKNKGTTMDPSYAKWGYYHRAPDADKWYPASAAHIGLASIFEKHPEVVALLEVREWTYIYLPPGVHANFYFRNVPPGVQVCGVMASLPLPRGNIVFLQCTPGGSHLFVACWTDSTSFLPSHLSLFLPSFLPSSFLPTYLPTFLPSLLPTFLPSFPSFLPSYLPSFLPSNLQPNNVVAQLR